MRHTPGAANSTIGATQVAPQAMPTPATQQACIGLVMPVALKRGGCETMLINLLKANLDGPRQRYTVCFLENGPMIGEVREMGYRASVIDVGRLRHLHRYSLSVLRLARWLRREGVAQAISWMEKAHLYTGPAGILARVPTAWWLHSIDPGSRLMKLITALPTNLVFSDSQAAADVQHQRWPRRRTAVCHCAVDLERFSDAVLPSPEVSRERLGLPHGRPVVGIVARLQRWKGINVFLDAAADVIRSGADPAPFFVIVGGEHNLEPGVKEELEAQILRLGIKEQVLMAGYRDNVPLWMQACDVIVHASTGIEPFGTVIVEAMALGKKVIAARAGGPLEIIRDGYDGLLTPPGDAAALAAAIGRLLLDTPESQGMCRAARSRAAVFSADRLAAQLASKIAALTESDRDNVPA